MKIVFPPQLDSSDKAIGLKNSSGSSEYSYYKPSDSKYLKPSDAGAAG